MIKRIFRKIYYYLYLKFFGMNKFLRKKGVNLGENCHIYSNISNLESFLITIGNNVTISNDVQIITHDNSVCKILEGVTDIFGEVKIGDNCFIGARTIIMYGVTLPKNTIVAAGSVVTKSITEEGKIIGGNPAKIIGDVNSFAERVKPYAISLDNLSEKEKYLAKKNANLISR